MSLDIDLVIRGKDSKKFNFFEVRHLAVNFAINCEKDYKGSFDAWYKHISPIWREIANKDNPAYEIPTKIVYETNITHNLNIMAQEAGIYEALWRPHQLKPDYDKNWDDAEEYVFEKKDITLAKDIIPLLEKGLIDLKARPEYFKTFDSPNGWGLYIHFVPFVEKYLKACKEYPEAIIKISR